MHQAFIDEIMQLTGDSELHNVTVIQSLWSGYGECVRVFSPKLSRWLVAKVVNPPSLAQQNHPRGWQGTESHYRKCHSYKVEGYFYRTLQPNLPPPVVTPTCYGFAQHSDEHFVLLLDDLQQRDFALEVDTANLTQCFLVIEWLATMHAHFALRKTEPRDANVWPRGTYWHLATRAREWHVMQDDKLKQCAAQLDTLIETCPFQTLVHGDAKLANFIFTQNNSAVAGFDFQYFGYGIGVQDVAYFIGSALPERDIARFTEQLLDTYFSALSSALANRQIPQSEIRQLCETWREYYCVACADFCRFLSGWSPQHKKLNKALYAQSELALAQYC